MSSLNLEEVRDKEIERFIREVVSESLSEDNKALTNSEIEGLIESYLQENPQTYKPDDERIASIVSEEVANYIRSNMDDFIPDAPVVTGDGSVDDVSNPAYYGGDPTGKEDASEAILAAARATSVVTLPPGSKFLVDKSIELPPRTVLRGSTFMHFGNSNHQLIRGNNIPDGEPAITNVYFMEGISMMGDKKKGVGIRLTGYCCRVLNCSFSGLSAAIEVPGGVANRFGWNQFVGCGDGIRNTFSDESSVITTTMIEYNHFQYVTNPINYEEGQMFSCQFIGNVFERVQGDAIRASFLRDCRITDNWWEHRDGAEQDYPNITLSRSNESMGNIFTTAHCQYGWRNILSEDPSDRNGMAGGMSYQGDTLQIQGRTQGGVRLTKQGLYQRHSAWVPHAYPFTVESGRGSGNGKAAHLDLRSHDRVRLQARHGLDITSSRTNPEVGYAIRILNRSSKDDQGEYTNNRWTELRNVRGRWEETKPNIAGTVDIGKNEERLANIAIPTMVVFSRDGVENNTSQFDSVNYDTEGQIQVESPYQFQNPSLQITVEDRGIFFDGMEWSGGRGSGDNERKATKFTLFFVDRDGNPATPRYVHMQIAIFPYSDYKS